MLRTIWNGYKGALHSRPLITKSLTSATTMAFGDVIAQRLFPEPDSPEYSIERTARLSFIDLAWSGPIMHFWYTFLDNSFTGISKRAITAKMLLDQFIFTPTIIGGFFVSNALIEGKTLGHAVDKIRQDMIPALVGNVVLWPAAMWINFRFIPHQYSVLYISGVAIIWNTYFAWLSSTKVRLNQPSQVLALPGGSITNAEIAIPTTAVLGASTPIVQAAADDDSASLD
eukprot:TRINITY_DN7021_c0_g1_i1.p1 TRINITY_DN7021_c0_g1~~TRINITY_DN7021_c0_g1_i1.p1  ORF type:complete len:228 (-),score=8.21 TRINITY_DN7021_c0_g1_i1:85-768(-)